MSELLHVLEPSNEHGSPSLKATGNSTARYYADCLTTRPWPVRQKRTGTSRMVSHIRHNNEPNLSEFERFYTGLLTPGTGV